MIIVSAILVLVGLLLRRKTIIYVDISGSMSVQILQDAMRTKLHELRGVRYNSLNTIIKPFDHKVHGGQRFSRPAIECISRIFGGGSDFTNVLADFQTSGARRAIVVSDGVFHQQMSIPANVQMITVG